VHLMRDIKKECDYLGIPDPVPATKPTTQAQDDSQKKAKSILIPKLSSLTYSPPLLLLRIVFWPLVYGSFQTRH